MCGSRMNFSSCRMNNIEKHKNGCISNGNINFLVKHLLDFCVAKLDFRKYLLHSSLRDNHTHIDLETFFKSQLTLRIQVPESPTA